MSSNVQLQYKRVDIEGGVLVDPAEINYYKQVQSNDVLNNYMLGDFNEKGNYVLKREIVNELIQVTKIMQHSYGKTLFCTSSKQIKEFGVLEFAVKINRQGAKQGEAVATLELLEPIDKVGGYYQNINTVLIGIYTDVYNADFLEKVYSAFNILSGDDYKGRKKLEDDITEILARKNYLAELKKLSEVGLNKTEKEFYEARIEALSQDTGFGKSILVRLQLEFKKINKMFLDEKSPNYYSRMNQLIDKILDETKKSMDKTLLEKLRNAEKAYINVSQMEIDRAKTDMFKSKVLPEQVVIIQAKNQEENKNEVAKTPVAKIDKESLIQLEPTVAIKNDDVEKMKQRTINNKMESAKPVIPIKAVDDIEAFASGQDEIAGKEVPKKETENIKEDIQVNDKGNTPLLKEKDSPAPIRIESAKEIEGIPNY